MKAIKIRGNGVSRRKMLSVAAAHLVFSCGILLSACGGGSGESGSDIPDAQLACGSLRGATRIVGGASCSANATAIVKLRFRTLAEEGYCTGTMITPTRALTAAHCVADLKELISGHVVVPGDLHASIVSADGSQTLAEANAITIFPRVGEDFTALVAQLASEGFDLDSSSSRFERRLQELLTSTGFRDVALVKFPSNLALPSMPISSHPVRPGQVAAIYGYGLTEPGGSVADLPNELGAGYIRTDNVGSYVFSAKFKDGAADTCNGDSGGPVILDGSLVGLTSLGLADCSPGERSVYAGLSNPEVAEFIRSEAPGVVFQAG